LLTVDVGTTATWTNTSDRPHTVTDRGGTFDTDPILPGQTGSVTFTAPGTYHFFCRINPSKMNGIISVGDAGKGFSTVRMEAIDPALDGESLRFEPPVITVATGTTILFANVGGKPHTLTADDGSFDTGVVAPGAEGGRFAGNSATFTLTKPGRYNFHCEIHPTVMKGTITVEGDARAGPAPAPASSAPRTAKVDMVDFSFKDPQVSVGPGGEVTFDNTGQAPHTATFDDVDVNTGTIQPGATGKLTAPTKPGSYSYRCTIHPAKMRGVIVVVGENTADPAAVPAAAPGKAVAVGGGGPGGGVTKLALATGVIGGFFGGAGVSAFARPKRKAKPSG
jgi:plastocyanin